MPVDSYHGVRVIETKVGAKSLKVVASSIIYIVATGPAADAAFFPANTVVAVTDLATAITKAGATGTLKANLEAIDNITRTIVLVYRAVQGGAPATLETAVVDGVKAARTAQALTGFKPRILGAPGLDTEAVAVELALTAAKLRGMAYASTNGATTIPTITTYRNKFSARELKLVHGDWSSAGTTVNGVATAMAMRALVDNEYGWNQSISNIVVPGVTGIINPLFFDLSDSNTDVGVLNAMGITCLVYHSGGFRYWGARTCSADTDFVFEGSVRTAQILADTIAEGMAWAIDKKLTPSLARDLIAMINKLIRRMVPNYLAGGECFISDENTQDTLAAGSLKLRLRYTPTPPLEDLTISQEITTDFLADFAAQVVSGA